MFRVTNTNDFDFTGRYDGKDYFFPKVVDGNGGVAYVPDDAATHIFGIGHHDKSKVLIRHGWSNISSSIPEGMKILNNFRFDVPEIAYDAPMALVDGHGPAPVVQDAPGESADDDEPGVVAEPENEPDPTPVAAAAAVADTVSKVAAGRRPNVA